MSGRSQVIRRVELLVPQGTLLVEQTFQVAELGTEISVMETHRTPYLNGELIWWRPDTRDMLRAAADALSLMPADGNLLLSWPGGEVVP